MRNVGFEESPSNGKRAEQIRLSKDPMHATCKDEKRMIPARITRQTVLHQIAHMSARGSGKAKMEEREIFESPGFPSQHVGFNLVNRVPSRACPQSSDRVPARPSVNLARASDMEPGIRLELKLMAQIVVDSSASNPQVRMLSEMLEAPLKIIWSKPEVTIEFHYKIPVGAVERAVCLIESIHHAPTGFPKTSVRPVDGADPGRLGCKVIDNGAGSVGRTVVNYHPLRGALGLATDGFDGVLYVFFFVAHWGDDYVSCHRVIATSCDWGMPR
jgi:hypothetical protein